MRWVDRGPEPNGVAGYARQFTQGWVDYFQNATGGRPTDHYWGEFRPHLGNRTNSICWYCERECNDATGGRSPTVDHFRPLSRFPQLAYEWSNWIFSCQRCNSDYKQDKWPNTGYVDPCADNVTERPDQYFDYDSDTGEIVPKFGLPGTARRRALDTINDLGLNELDVMYYRIDWTRRFISDLLLLPPIDRQAFIASLAEQPIEYAGVTRMVVDQLRRDGHVQPGLP